MYQSLGGTRIDRRGFVGGAVGLAATGAIASRAVMAQDAGERVMIGAFDVGPGGSPQGFNPFTQGSGHLWLDKYYSKLILYTPDFTEFVGESAESWDVNADATEIVFHLREGITWHDGEPFTSADVKFTIDTALNPDSAALNLVDLSSIEEVTAPDPMTVVVKSQSNSALLSAFTRLFLVPKHHLEDIALPDLVQNEWWRTAPVGSGPFKWDNYVPDQYLELVANDSYWRGRPQLDRLINRYIPEGGNALISLQADEIQFTYITLDEAMLIEGDPNLEVLAGPSGVINFLLFNMAQERFQDLRVRQAFMYAVDRQLIVDQLLSGNAAVAPCVYTADQYVGDGLNDYARDVDLARSLLEEANWDAIKGDPIEIITYYQDQLSYDILVTVQQQLAEVGVDVTIRVLDALTFRAQANSPDYDMQYSGGSNGPDPDKAATLFESTALPPGGLNRGFYDNPEIDQAFATGRATSDPGERAAAYQEVCGIINTDLPWMPMWVTTRFGAVSTRVSNFIYTPEYSGGSIYSQAELWEIADK